MKKPLLALALSTALMGGFATAAIAEVIDAPDVVPQADETKLDSALNKLGTHNFVVEFVDHAASAPSQLARQRFKERGLGDRDGVIVVAVGDKKVGVYLGRGFEQRGVTSSVISQHNKSDFFPYARKGEYARGAAALAKGLVDAGANAPVSSGRRTSSNTYSSNTGGQRRSGGGFPWGLVIVVALAGGGVWWWMNRAKGNGLPERLEALRAQQGRIVSGAIKLAEVDQLARFQDGDIKKAYQRLGQNTSDTLEKARAFGEKFDQAEAALKGKKYDEAEKLITALERDVDDLEPNVAAAITALEGLEAGGLTGAQAMAQAELPKQIRASSRRMSTLRTTYEKDQKRARSLGIGEDDAFVNALEEAQRLLTTTPVDIAGADRLLDEADEALTRFKHDVEVAAERKAEEDRRRAAEAAEAAQSAAIISAVSGGHHHHDHYDHHHHDAYASSDAYSSNDASWSSGSSSDDSWGSSSSDSSWDSGGGSSSDDNW